MYIRYVSWWSRRDSETHPLCSPYEQLPILPDHPRMECETLRSGSKIGIVCLELLRRRDSGKSCSLGLVSREISSTTYERAGLYKQSYNAKRHGVALSTDEKRMKEWCCGMAVAVTVI